MLTRNLLLSLGMAMTVVSVTAQEAPSKPNLMGAWLGVEGGVNYAPAMSPVRYIRAQRAGGAIDLYSLQYGQANPTPVPSFGLDFGFRPWNFANDMYFGFQLGMRYDRLYSQSEMRLVHTEDSVLNARSSDPSSYDILNIDAQSFGLHVKGRFIHSPRPWFRWGLTVGSLTSYTMSDPVDLETTFSTLGISYETPTMSSLMSTRLTAGGEVNFVAGPVIMGLSVDAGILNITEAFQTSNVESTVDPFQINAQFLRYRTAKAHVRFMLNTPDKIQAHMEADKKAKDARLARWKQNKDQLDARSQAKYDKKREEKAIKKANKKANKEAKNQAGSETPPETE